MSQHQELRRRLSLADLFSAYSTAVQSKVRIRFNRPLTWSERETFRTFVASRGAWTHRFNNSDPSEVHIESNRDSRETVKLVQDFVATEFLNIHPRSVKTITPETRV